MISIYSYQQNYQQPLKVQPFFTQNGSEFNSLLSKNSPQSLPKNPTQFQDSYSRPPNFKGAQSLAHCFKFESSLFGELRKFRSSLVNAYIAIPIQNRYCLIYIDS